MPKRKGDEDSSVEVEYVPPPWQKEPKHRSGQADPPKEEAGERALALRSDPALVQRRSKRRRRRRRQGGSELVQPRAGAVEKVERDGGEFAKVAVLGDEGLQPGPLDEKAEKLARGLLRYGASRLESVLGPFLPRRRDPDEEK